MCPTLSIHVIYILTGSIFTLSVIGEFLPSVLKWKHRYLQGLMLQLLIAFLGIWVTNLMNFEKKEFSKNALFMSSVIKLDHEGEKYNRYISRTFELKRKNPANNSLLYFYVPNTFTQFSAGTIFITSQPPSKIPSKINPGDFDFASFAGNKGIHFNLFIQDSSDIIKIGYEKQRLHDFLLKIKMWVLQAIRKNLSDPIDAGLTEALLIGYKEDLDSSLQESYTNTGVSHIIAISGMHLGLIFYLLDLLTRTVANKRISKLLAIGMTLPLLWVFSLLTGASASVLRSVLVFTFLIIGNLLNKRKSSINSLMASSFVLLLINPKMIYDVGFQLSYAAVLSILIFEPLISKLLFLKNKILNYLWSMISITLAAQILTTPFVLLHFKQFPVFFLFTNLVAVPISSLILLLAILLCVFEILFLNTSMVSKSIHLLIQLMNDYINQIDKIPFNNIHVNFNLPLFISTLFSIALLTHSLTKNKRPSLTVLSVAIFIPIFIHTCNFINHINTKQILVLNIKNQTCLIHQHGRTARMLVSEELLQDKKQLTKLTKKLKNGLGIEKWEFTSLSKLPYLIQFATESHQPKFTLLSNFKESLKNLITSSEAPENNKYIIADGSNKLWKIKQWEKEAQELHLPLHLTTAAGPFIMPCNPSCN
jgi:competence protein ComEC